MATQSLARNTKTNLPSIFDNFFKPWDEWFDTSRSPWNSLLSVPAVNICETKDEYKVSLAAPGMQKNDFKIDIKGNMLTISSEKEENKDESDKKFTRKEYSFSSFSRSFNIPEDVNQEKIEAKYDAGVLELMLPKREEAKKTKESKQISVK